MVGIIDSDTHIAEGETMWAMIDKEMLPRRPVLLRAPEDTLYGPRNAFWLIDGSIFPKPNGKGSFRLITPSASKLESARGDIHLAYREMTDIPGRLGDMDKLGVQTQVVFPTLFLIYITDDAALDIALARAYNRFLAQACERSAGRMRWVVVPPLHSRHRRRADARQSLFRPDLSRGQRYRTADPDSYRSRLPAVLTVVRCGAEPYFWS